MGGARRKAWIVCAIFAASAGAESVDVAPALQWVKAMGGSGNSSVAGTGVDARGNLYVVGSTTSLDFPVTSAAQSRPGGSTLVRIRFADSTATRLFPANVPTIVAAVADTAGTLYVSSGDRLWKSADSGETWSLLREFPTSPGGFVTLAIDPANPATLYAGSVTLGVYKSIDGGVSWTATNNGLPARPNGGINIVSLWVAPSGSNIVFASLSPGLARSADGGNTWTIVSPDSTPSALPFDPFHPGTVYMAAGSISKSVDNGQTFSPWSALPDGVPANLLIADPKHDGVWFATSYLGVYRSADAGRTWTLQMAGNPTALVADPSGSALYANLARYGIVKSTDGFATVTPIGPAQGSIRSLLVAGGNLFEIAAPTNDAFVVKLDHDGNIVYSTYFGGSGDDTAAALAVAPDGSVYVTGSTNSIDLPVTAGAYLTKAPDLSIGSGSGSYLLKVNPDGSVAWSTYFTGPQSTVASLALDADGHPFVGGSTSGNHPTTAGAYQTSFQQSSLCTGFIGCFAGPTAAFVTKFDANGAGLLYSTYAATDNRKDVVQVAQALAVDAAGNAWIGASVNANVVPTGGGPNATVLELDRAGAAVLASAAEAGMTTVAALTLDGSNIYVAGTYNPTTATFPVTPGAFQSATQPAFAALPYQGQPGGGADAFVAKFDGGLTLVAATLLGGELPDAATAVTVDTSGTVIVSGYSDSRALPTHAPFQTSFSARSGFVAGFDSGLTRLLFSTYLGDGRPFIARAAIPDQNGDLLLAGSTLTAGGTFIGGDNGAAFSAGGIVVANRIALPAAPSVRLDSVRNFAGRFAGPLAPGETILATGAGFGPGAQILLDGVALPTVSATATTIVAAVPDTAKTSGVYTVQASSGGSLSNPVLAPVAGAAPAIYSVDGSGVGQAYILNSDGTLNSPANPAAPGSAITIFATGAGQYSTSNGYAVTALAPSVYIDGFYCNGIAATDGPAAGLPGNVYELSVYVPDPAKLAQANPDLKNFQFPAKSAIQLVMGPVSPLNPANSGAVSQIGLYINIGQ